MCMNAACSGAIQIAGRPDAMAACFNSRRNASSAIVWAAMYRKSSAVTIVDASDTVVSPYETVAIGDWLQAAKAVGAIEDGIP